MVVVIDSQIAGISGDMLLSSLVNLGANKTKIIEGVKLAEKEFSDTKIQKIEFKKIKKNGIEAIELIVDCKEHTHERRGTEIKKCIEKISNDAKLSQKAKQFAIGSIDALLCAESKIHGASLESVHFHEAASIDTVIDIIGTAIALDDLNFFDEEIECTPVAVGGGTVTFSHGTTTNPANAILEIFSNSGIIISGGRTKHELTTPTGACMLVNLTKNCSEFYPTMRIKSVGYGAGQNDFEGFSNVLKVVHGEKINYYDQDSVKILETNVDDVSGEVLGNMIEKIMLCGAKDVTISSAITKKGRPTNIVSVICDSGSMNTILELLISETGTLGVRVRTSERFIVPRSLVKMSVDIENQTFSIRYKTSSKDFKNFKIESDDIKIVANTLNRSYRLTEELIRKEIIKNLKND